MKSRFFPVIDEWPSCAELGRDLGVPAGTVRIWRNRRKAQIPARYWLSLIEAAAARGIAGITLERLATLAESAPQ